MQKKWIFLAGTLLLILAAIWLYNQYQQPRENVLGKDADYILNAVDLYNEFEKDEAGATAKYSEKILVVSGTIKEVLESGEQLAIKLNTGNENGDINADFDNKNIKEKIFTGVNVKIKGRCTGFLSDIYLVDCIIEN